MVNPSDCEVCFAMRRVTSWLHVWFGIQQEGVNPCRMVPSMRDEVRVQLHDVTGKVQRARLRVAALMLREIKKKNSRTKASLAVG